MGRGQRTERTGEPDEKNEARKSDSSFSHDTLPTSEPARRLSYCLLQRGHGYYEDSEDSQSSQETDSSQEVTQHLNPWSRILDEAQERHEVQLNALVDEYKSNGDSENIAHLKAQNALIPLYRKELRKVLLEYLQWMRAMKKDYTFQKVMETRKDLKDTDGFDWLESTELAIDKRKFLLNRLFVKQPIPQDED